MSRALHEITPRERLFELIKQEDAALSHAARVNDLQARQLSENEITTLKAVALRSFGRSATF